jgi:hypothetical protein
LCNEEQNDDHEEKGTTTIIAAIQGSRLDRQAGMKMTLNKPFASSRIRFFLLPFPFISLPPFMSLAARSLYISLLLAASYQNAMPCRGTISKKIIAQRGNHTGNMLRSSGALRSKFRYNYWLCVRPCLSFFVGTWPCCLHLFLLILFTFFQTEKETFTIS